MTVDRQGAEPKSESATRLMRIALISFEYPPHFYGGIGNYTRQAALMLRRRGHDVEVFAASPDTTYDDALEGVSVRYGECKDRWQFAPVAAEMFAREHARQPFDVVEAPELASEGREIFRRFPEVPSVVRLHTPAYLAAWIDRATFGKCAVFVQAVRYSLAELVRGGLPRNGINFWRGHTALFSWYDPAADEERRTALLADTVASPSRLLASRIAHDWQLPPEVLRVVPYPHTPDPRALQMRFPKGEMRTICFYGGIKAFKGVDVLARAIPQVLRRHPQLRFVFAGASQVSPVRNISLSGFLKGSVCAWEDMGGWLRRQLSGCGDAVEFRGQLDREGILSLLEESDLCVFPSRFDNFPNACLEAMAAGRVVVGTRSGGMEEMLGSGNVGLLVDPDNARDLKAAIEWAVTHPAECAEKGRNARHHIRTTYSDDIIAPQHENLYVDAIAAKQGSNVVGLHPKSGCGPARDKSAAESVLS